MHRGRHLMPAPPRLTGGPLPCLTHSPSPGKEGGITPAMPPPIGLFFRHSRPESTTDHTESSRAVALESRLLEQRPPEQRGRLCIVYEQGVIHHTSQHRRKSILYHRLIRTALFRCNRGAVWSTTTLRASGQGRATALLASIALKAATSGEVSRGAETGRSAMLASEAMEAPWSIWNIELPPQGWGSLWRER